MDAFRCQKKGLVGQKKVSGRAGEANFTATPHENISKRMRYIAFKPRQKPFLTEKHKADRLKWAREHIKWTIDDWRCDTFSDEATFELGLFG